VVSLSFVIYTASFVVCITQKKGIYILQYLSLLLLRLILTQTHSWHITDIVLLNSPLRFVQCMMTMINSLCNSARYAALFVFNINIFCCHYYQHDLFLMCYQLKHNLTNFMCDFCVFYVHLLYVGAGSEEKGFFIKKKIW